MLKVWRLCGDVVLYKSYHCLAPKIVLVVLIIGGPETVDKHILYAFPRRRKTQTCGEEH